MIEQSMIEQLIGAAGEGQWWRLVGVVLVVLIALVRFFTFDRFSVAVGEWSSAISAMLGGVAAALLAGTTWWHALLIGLLVAPTGRGLLEKLRSLLPERPQKTGGAPVAVLLLLSLCGPLAACGAVPCQVERSVVSALDVGLGAAEEAIPEPDEDAALALRLTRGAVMLGDAAVDGCDLVRDGEGWQAWVGLALEVAGGLASVFGAAGPEDVPEEPPPALLIALERLRYEAGASSSSTVTTASTLYQSEFFE